MAAVSNWEPIAIRGTQPTEYTYEPVADGSALRADSSDAASGLAIGLPDDVDPIALTWRWRLERCLDNPQELVRAGDDFAARVFVLFGRSRTWTPWGWLRRQLFSSPFGSIRPRRALSFVWASGATMGDATYSPVSDDVFQIAARSGCQETGWVTERYALAPHFTRGFDEPMPRVVGVAVMTDTDDTGGHAVAWYHDVALDLQTGVRMPLPFAPQAAPGTERQE